jgi:hypothetical protein
VKKARVRHVAAYSNGGDTCTLEIVQVHEMEVQYLREKEDGFHQLSTKPRGYAPRLESAGSFPVFYEAHVRSTKADRILMENRTLGFAEEAKWTPQSLRSSGAFDDLVKCATDLVKQMDGVAYHCDNNQGGMIHGQPPANMLEADERAVQAGLKPKVEYW